MIRDHDGHFVSGFHCNLGVATSVMAELWGLVYGLKLARSLNLTVVLAELDSEVVVNMIRTKNSNCFLLKPLLEEAIQFIDSPDWNCSVQHVFREANGGRISLPIMVTRVISVALWFQSSLRS